MKKLFTILVILAFYSQISFAGTWSISQNIVESANDIVVSSNKDVHHKGTTYTVVIATEEVGDYARIYIPFHAATGATINYRVSDTTYDSSFVNISYGVSAGFGSASNRYIVESIQDSSLFWYKEQGRKRVNINSDFFPSPFLVIDVASASPNQSSWPVTTTIEVHVEEHIGR